MRKLLILTIIISLFSCSTTRRETKIDNKAIGRVLAKPPLTDIVGKAYLGQHPISQTPIYIKGKDSIIEVPRYIDVVKDSFIKVKYPDLNLDSLRNAVMRIITVLRVDTLKTPDLSTIGLLNAEQISHALTTGQLTQIQKDNTTLKKDLGKSKLHIVLIIVSAALIIGGMVYLLFKK